MKRQKAVAPPIAAVGREVLAARADSAALKRRVSELERSLKQAARAAHGQPLRAAPAEESESTEQFRFRASDMASNRKRQGLSAADFRMLVGASGQSVYSWEQGKARPTGRNLAAIAALRGIGKREMAQRLAAMKSIEQS